MEVARCEVGALASQYEQFATTCGKTIRETRRMEVVASCVRALAISTLPLLLPERRN
jgi:hypothetical protein